MSTKSTMHTMEIAKIFIFKLKLVSFSNTLVLSGLLFTSVIFLLRDCLQGLSNFCFDVSSNTKFETELPNVQIIQYLISYSAESPKCSLSHQLPSTYVRVQMAPIRWKTPLKCLELHSPTNAAYKSSRRCRYHLTGNVSNPY